MKSALLVLLWGWLATAAAFAAPADDAFRDFLEELWPEAQTLGVSRQTFDAATRDLEPDLALPDLVLPGGAEKPPGGQPEFTATPSAYLSDRPVLATQGRALLAKHRATLSAIEQRFGVPGEVVLAIWGRETGYGAALLLRNAVRVLATQAYLGRRKDQFRQEFLLALKIVEEGHVPLADMKSSWAGAMGHAQVLPSGFYKYAVDFDGDGRRDVWNSAPDALATVAAHLVDAGWQAGQRWAIEVVPPPDLDCTTANPDNRSSVAEWLARGFALPNGSILNQQDLAEDTSLLQPAGPYGPAFLIGRNYFAIKNYNFSDLYVLSVGQLSDRIAGSASFSTPWRKIKQAGTSEIEAMQRRLTELGLYRDKIDGKAGMRTRLAIGLYQKTNALILDCWPGPAVLEHMLAGEQK